MKYIFICLIAVISLSLGSCCKSDTTCENGQIRIIGSCFNEPRALYLFSGFPDFYCFSDSIAVGLPISINDDDVLYSKGYLYLKVPKDKDNIFREGSSNSGGFGDFFNLCYDSPKQNVTYNTFLIVKDYDKVDNNTRVLNCKLELRSAQSTFFPYTVLDSSTVVLNRVN